MAFSLSSVKPTSISFILISILLFFLLSPFPNHPSTTPIIPHTSLLNSTRQFCSSILQTPSPLRCNFSLLHCCPSNGVFNYFSLHFCIFQENPYLTIPFLAICVFLQFYILVKTAQSQFSVVVTKLSSLLNLSPSMGAVTLLALGNGAPDVFASVAAVGGGQARTGFGAILWGNFVSWDFCFCSCGWFCDDLCRTLFGFAGAFCEGCVVLLDCSLVSVLCVPQC